MNHFLPVKLMQAVGGLFPPKEPVTETGGRLMETLTRGIVAL